MTATNELPTILDNSEFIWSPEWGLGFHRRPPIEYKTDYFLDYIKRDQTRMGQALTHARIELAMRWGIDPERHVDVGIGGGKFCKDFGCWGFDINEEAQEWLGQRGKFASPTQGIIQTASFWDSLEHIPDPEQCLLDIETVLVSIPVFSSAEEALNSKHYKPGEHIWYFTPQGFIKFMEYQNQGFTCLEMNLMETLLGRDGIATYIFQRKE